MNTLCFLSVDPNPVPAGSALNGHSATFSASAVTDVTDVTQPGRERGCGILDDVEALLRRYIAYPSEHALIANVLWIAHTHVMDVWETTPRLAFLSPEPGSGKTMALELTGLLVPRPDLTVGPSAAYLFRVVSQPAGQPTILFDEIDTIFGRKAGDHEDIRSFLNAGHHTGATVGRCVVRGKDYDPRRFPAYCAVAMAGIGDLPNTIRSRSVVIRMRPPGLGEHVEKFREREARAAGHALRDRLVAWSPELGACVQFSGWPTPPDGVDGRDADVWEPLLAVADAAGGAWPERARAAAVALVAQSKKRTPSLGIRLLADVREVFGDRNAMRPADILAGLYQLPEAPWADLEYGKSLSSRRLSSMLRDYDITSMSVRIDGKTERGYKREDLADAWVRYLPPLGSSDGPVPSSPQGAVTPVTTVTDDEHTSDGASEPELFDLFVPHDPYQVEF